MQTPGFRGQPMTPSHRTQDERMFERPMEDLEDALEVFMAERTHLLRVAYRVVGDAAGAEDVVQDAWLRWQRMNRQEVNNPAAWLTTATTHLAINMIQTARYRHEIPTDRPRAAVAGVAHEPMAQTEQAIAVERMLGFLMARLTPSELAAYLLRKCFVYPYQEIAAVLRTSAPNARQLVRRAQTSIADDRRRRSTRWRTGDSSRPSQRQRAMENWSAWSGSWPKGRTGCRPRSHEPSPRVAASAATPSGPRPPAHRRKRHESGSWIGRCTTQPAFAPVRVRTRATHQA